MKKFKFNEQEIYAGFHREHGAVVYNPSAQHETSREDQVSLYVPKLRRTLILEKAKVKKNLIQGDENSLKAHVQAYMAAITEPTGAMDLTVEELGHPPRQRRHRASEDFLEKFDSAYPNDEERQELRDQMLEDEDNNARAHEDGWFYSDED